MFLFLYPSVRLGGRWCRRQGSHFRRVARLEMWKHALGGAVFSMGSLKRRQKKWIRRKRAVAAHGKRKKYKEDLTTQEGEFKFPFQAHTYT